MLLHGNECCMMGLFSRYTVTNVKDKHDTKTIDAFKPQPMTVAERQRKYRERKKSENGRRFDFQVSSETYSRLDIIALHCNESKKAVLERLIAAEFHTVVNSDDFDVNRFR